MLMRVQHLLPLRKSSFFSRSFSIRDVFFEFVLRHFIKTIIYYIDIYIFWPLSEKKNFQTLKLLLTRVRFPVRLIIIRYDMKEFPVICLSKVDVRK